MIRAIVVDDEKPSLDKLAKMLQSSGLVELKGSFTKPVEALAFLKENKVDAVFLDIEMPDMNGIELSSHVIDLQEGASVVFVTAFNQYAVEAFRLNAIDYLMKPVSANRLEETLNKIQEAKGINVHTGGISVSCFGRFTVSSGKEVVKFRTEKAEELLAFMLDRRGGYISRSEIIDSLWADFDGERSLIHFNTTLHYVKKALLQYGIKIPFIYDRGGYKFDLEGLICDYINFNSFIEKAEIPSEENIFEFEEIAGIFTGEYLSGWEYDWAEIKRLMLNEQFFCMILEMAEYYKGAGSYQRATKWLRAGLLKEPLHRELNYRLIEIMILINEYALATKYYDIYRNGLKKKLGQKPDEAFKKLLR